MRHIAHTDSPVQSPSAALALPGVIDADIPADFAARLIGLRYGLPHDRALLVASLAGLGGKAA